MASADYKKISLILGLFLLAEVFSYLGFASAVANPIIFAAFALIAAVLTLYKLEYGLLLVAGELLISSFGYLIFLDSDYGRVPFRLVLFIIVMLAFVIRFRSSYWQNIRNFPLLKWFGLLAIFIIIGAANGLLRGHAPYTVFLDLNAWLFFLLLLPAVAVYGQGKREHLTELFFAGALWVSFKTLILLFIFTHDLSIAPDIYNWLRRTLVGEMTPTTTGWPRVFLQGQIYPAIAFFIIFWQRAKDWEWQKFKEKHDCFIFAAAAIFLSAVLISFSRSFWVGLIVAMAVSLLALWKVASFKKALAAALWALLALVLAFVIVYLVAALPHLRPLSGGFSSEFLKRATSGGEAALASRWSLLPVLGAAIAQEPFLGQGYGATVTYFSRDPRVLEKSPSGEYTTYAFEWGYLDIWLKIGLLGLLSYLILLGQMLVGLWKQGSRTQNYLFFGLAAALIFLAVTNFFTPYLNHPLGIGALIAGAFLAGRGDNE